MLKWSSRWAWIGRGQSRRIGLHLHLEFRWRIRCRRWLLSLLCTHHSLSWVFRYSWRSCSLSSLVRLTIVVNPVVNLLCGVGSVYKIRLTLPSLISDDTLATGLHLTPAPAPRSQKIAGEAAEAVDDTKHDCKEADADDHCYLDKLACLTVIWIRD